MAVPRILEVLKRHRIPASFFVPAVVALLHPDEQRRVIDEGHEIGMHGWIHEWTGELLENVDKNDGISHPNPLTWHPFMGGIMRSQGR